MSTMSIFFAPLDEQVKYIKSEMSKSKDGGVRVDWMPADGVRAMILSGEAEAECGWLFKKAKRSGYWS